MIMKKLLVFLIIGFVCKTLIGQTPHGFNYQAVARDGLGNAIPNANLIVKIGLLTDTIGNIYVWEEQHSVKTNPSGIFSLVIGTGTKTLGSASSFIDIDWISTQIFIRIKLTYLSVERTMGTAKLWSVPYSLVSEEAKGMAAGSRLEIVGTNDASSDALFEVKRKDGQTVFAVYNDAVNVYVPDQVAGKKAKGGFAIGGFDQSKGFSQQYFSVTPDSIRLYINDVSGKGAKGGFAIGGFNETKGPEKKYLSLYGAKTIDTITNASQIMWYPNKEAFLAGRIEILSPDSVGKNSFTTGYKSKAIGNYSHALGYESIARGNNSTAIGRSAISGPNSFALGNFSSALGNDSYAIGSASKASGNTAFALGVGSKSSGLGSLSLGFQSEATYPYAVAIGYQSKALQYTAHAFGLKAEATGFSSLALGMYSEAKNNYSTSLGFHSRADKEYSMAIGYYAKATGYDAYAIGSNAEAGGEKSFAIGSYGLLDNGTPNTSRPTMTAGYYTLAFGMGAQASKVGSMALGVNSTASGDQSVSIGFGTSAEAQFSTALGYRSIAHGFKSISIGAHYNVTYNKLVWHLNATTGNWTFVPTPVTIDKQNLSDGDYSIAIGNGNLSDNGGLTLGTNNNATSFGSVAIGHSNVADSAFSFAAGFANNAIGLKAFALGENLVAQAANSFVIGAFNLPSGTKDEWLPAEQLFVIGNGNPGARSNAFQVLKNGNVILSQDIMQGVGIPLSVGLDGTIMKQTSSSRYKTDIYHVSDVSWLYDMQPVSFVYRNDPGMKRQYGFIAEDVEKTNPDLVLYLEGKPEGLNYNSLFAPMIKALQDQKQMIDNLNSKNTDLTLENEALKARLEKLEMTVSSFMANQK
jgi:hypothetical protein